ncbi:hypothetical protein [Zhihengliuella halotolerans]|uniref:hypothetical protein n=1 Tax=Zhihengliuella halotolerans TaxID=370736 RepID=UPI001CA4C785|nr:hypothetical protein [Zhihengliuella halotolerans]
MTPNNTPNRALQQDARAWSKFTGTKYTTALRQMSSPLAQGLLGKRVSARHLIRTLSEHDLVGARGGDPVLGENGFRSESPWQLDGKSDFIELALITEFLRMFTPTSAAEVGSYSLKHTAEWFLSPRCSYVSNGRLIWAAAAMGLSITDPDGEGPNLLIGISEREHDYVRRMVGHGQSRPRADHYLPAGYEHLRDALTRAGAGELVTSDWVPPVPTDEPAPFHDWLVRQVGRNDAVGDLAGDYSAGVHDSDHHLARTAGDLLTIFHETSHSAEAYDAAVTSIAEWMRTAPSVDPIRTKPVGESKDDHQGWGAGAGTTERYEYLCPCGAGAIIEEHDNIPGFREHDVRIFCDKCREEWRFVEGRGVRDWALEPTAMNTAA